MGFLSQEYWSGLPFPSPEDLPDPGTEPMSPASSHAQANSLPLSRGGGREAILCLATLVTLLLLFSK